MLRIRSVSSRLLLPLAGETDRAAGALSAGRWLVPLVGMLAIFILALYFPFTVQDGYIVARYAENWVDRGELVFNAGERVNALTSPLHVVLEAGLYKITGNSLTSYKIVAVGLWGWTVWRLLRALRHDPLGRAWAMITLGLTPPVLMWTVAGLETPLLAAIVTALALTATRPGPTNTRQLLLGGGLVGLAFVTRYDSVLFTLPVLLQLLLARRSPKAILAGGLLAAAAPVTWLLFSWRYYGDILPTSFYVKTPGLGLLKLTANGMYIAQFLLLVNVWPVLAFTASGRTLRETWRAWRPLSARTRWGVFIGLALTLLYGLSVAQTHMMFSFRFFAPYLPALWLVLADVPGRMAAQLAPPEAAAFQRRYGWLMAALVVFQLTQVGYTYAASLNGVSLLGEFRREGMRAYATEWTPLLGDLASEIRAHWQTQAQSAKRPPRIFTFAGGSLPYAYREAYFYEVLVSYRHECRVDGRDSADYTLLLFPRRGPIQDQLPYPPNVYTLIAEHEVDFDGSHEHLLVVYNPHPAPPRLPPTVSGPCLDSPADLTGDQPQ